MSDDINQPERRQQEVGEGQPETTVAEQRGSAYRGIPSGNRAPAAPTNLDDIIKRLREAIAEHPLSPIHGYAENIAALLDRLDKAERENERLREDAERYRWLTDNCGVEMEDGTLGIEFWSDPENWNDLDNAIDAAMAAER